MNDSASIAIVHALSAVPRGQYARAEEIAQRTGLATRTITTYVSRIRGEFGAGVIESEYGRGYRLGRWPQDEYDESRRRA